MMDVLLLPFVLLGFAVLIVAILLFTGLASVCLYLFFTELVDTPPNFNVSVDEYCDPIQPEPWGADREPTSSTPISQDDPKSEEQ